MAEQKPYPDPMTLTMRSLGIAACLLLGASCSDSGKEGEETPPADEEPVVEKVGDDGQFFPIPESHRTGAQGAQADALDGIGYAEGGEEAADISGILSHDSARASKNPRLYVSGHGPVATLISVEGEVLHEWKFPASRAFKKKNKLAESGRRFMRRAEVLPNGDLLAIFRNNGVVRMTPKAKVVWAWEGRAHHDLDVDEEGNVWVLDREVGLVPWIHEKRPILNDFIVQLSPEGKELQRISMLECVTNSPHADELRAEIKEHYATQLIREEEVFAKQEELFEGTTKKPVLLDLAGDVFHSNTIQWLDGGVDREPFHRGHLLICIRNMGRVVVVDPEKKSITWHLPGEPRLGIHEPQLLENGEILLFDNVGPENRGEEEGFSEVLRFDPSSGDVTWRYRAEKAFDFYSPIAATSQPLPNGNVLVTSSTQGRAFEVTPEGEIVWGFLSPHRAGERKQLVAFLPAMHVVEAPWLED